VERSVEECRRAEWSGNKERKMPRTEEHTTELQSHKEIAKAHV
jgi:hypothetical protein